MKAMIKLMMAALPLVAIATSCDPLEDKADRNAYNNAGEPISTAELTAALSITQLPNEDGKVEGDQYVIVKNSRPDIGGYWKVNRGGVITTYATDADTLILGTNGEYAISYVGISANKRVESDAKTITVTNVFDIYDKYLTGAENKADKTAKKTWRFRKVDWGSYCNMGAYGGWKYTSAGYTPESNFAWWANYTDLSVIGNQSMVMKYDGSKFTVYNADGSVKREGSFSYTHTETDQLVLGELTMSVRTMGAEYDEGSLSTSNIVYWLLRIDDNYITLFHPAKYTNNVDWSDYGWYVYYQCE